MTGSRSRMAGNMTPDLTCCGCPAAAVAGAGGCVPCTACVGVLLQLAFRVEVSRCRGSTHQPCTAVLSHSQHVMSWHLRHATVADEACVILIL
jgi:hypothetical protein